MNNKGKMGRENESHLSVFFQAKQIEKSAFLQILKIVELKKGINMKKIICLFLLLNTLVFSQQSNWKFINPLPDGESFLSIKAVGNKLFACGCFGKIIASEDKGNTWSKKDWLTVRNLFEVEFYDENTGLVVGGSGDIFKTTNGGKKWIRKTPPENVKLKDVEYINKDLILAVGEGDYTYRSTDGGETWNALKIAGKPGALGFML